MGFTLSFFVLLFTFFLSVTAIPLPRNSKPKTRAGGDINGLNGLKMTGHFTFAQLPNNGGVSIDIVVQGLDQKYPGHPDQDINYHIHEKAANKNCENLGLPVANLSADFKPLKAIKTNRRSFTAPNLSLFASPGKTNIVGRSITIHDGTTLAYLGCATILV